MYESTMAAIEILADPAKYYIGSASNYNKANNN